MRGSADIGYLPQQRDKAIIGVDLSEEFVEIAAPTTAGSRSIDRERKPIRPS
ncbi:hypothetical protein MPLB_1510221 [Mesorhizobium sp. ORS 3324]|nr:hypothetical protein MPLB_1510221 [Mesorhizobium sp. ORS 3324]